MVTTCIDQTKTKTKTKTKRPRHTKLSENLSAGFSALYLRCRSCVPKARKGLICSSYSPEYLRFPNQLMPNKAHPQKNKLLPQKRVITSRHTGLVALQKLDLFKPFILLSLAVITPNHPYSYNLTLSARSDAASECREPMVCCCWRTSVSSSMARARKRSRYSP
jgi:hypothetical protein